MASRQKKGRPGDLRDTMIAGIVLAHRAPLATLNITSRHTLLTIRDMGILYRQSELTKCIGIQPPTWLFLQRWTVRFRARRGLGVLRLHKSRRTPH